MKILVVEDDAPIAVMIRRGLEQAGYGVEVAPDGVRGLEMATDGLYGLIILDIMLPKMNGWQVCERLRASRSRTPVLMLTARDNVEDRVRGLDIGADDYLPKPFDFSEFMARVRALLRRETVHRTRLIQIDTLEIDTAQRRVSRGGAEVGLSHREYELLEALASREGHVLSREAIQERVWMDDGSISNTVDVYIGMLRKKIDAGHSVKLIQTVRGVGYTLRRGDESGDI